MPSPFKNYTKEELLKKAKNQKKVVIIHGLVVVLLFIVAGFNTYENGFSFSSFLPLFFIPMHLILLNDAKKIKEALKHKP
jgi:uncharacterized integral membrane protein